MDGKAIFFSHLIHKEVRFFNSLEEDNKFTNWQATFEDGPFPFSWQHGWLQHEEIHHFSAYTGNAIFSNHFAEMT